MPDWKEAIRQQLAELKLAPGREAEIVEELAQHAEDRYRELLSEGVEEQEARRMALAEASDRELLGNVEATNVPEPVVLGAGSDGNLFTGLAQDLRYGIRTLRKNPGFAAVAMLALALGIGANTAIFSVVNGVLLQPLEYPDADRVVTIWETSPEFGRSSVAYPNYLDWRRDSHSFTEMGTYRSDDLNFTGMGEPEQLYGVFTSASLFAALGVQPAVGRLFQPADDGRGGPCTVVLTYGFWQRRFSGDPNVLGRVLTLNGVGCTAIGVLPRGFPLRRNAAVYVPIEHYSSVELHSRESHPGLSVIARLKPGVSIEAARKEMSAIAGGLARAYPASNAGHGVGIGWTKEDIVGSIRPTLLLLAGAVAFVLIIACANVANLLLARSTARKREFAIRAALGAQRTRIVRQLLTESVLLSLGGAAIGLLLAHWGTRLVLAAVPDSLPRAEHIGIDPWVLLFTLAVSAVTGILFGLAPAFHSANAKPQDSLKEGTRGSGGGRYRAEGVFVVVEIALAVVLLAGAGLMIQSLWRLWAVNPGFNTARVLTTKVAVSPAAVSSAAGIQLAFRQMVERVEQVPGVRFAALTSVVPLGESDSEIPFWRGTGPQPPQERLTSAMFYIVTPEYPSVMQIPLLRGRFFDSRDRPGAPVMVVIDEVMARHVFPGEDPVGKVISLMVVGSVQVAGVVGHVKHWGLDSDDTSKIRDQIYFPFAQVPDKFMSEAIAGVTMVVRTGPEPMGLVSAIRSQVAGPTRDQPMYAVRTMEEIISQSLAERRFTMVVLIVFAASALLLAGVGIYSVMSYSVTRRVHELGIRATLGATRGEIVLLVLRQGMRLAGAGLVAGLLAALAVTRFLAGLLYGVRPADPATLAAVAVVLGGIALAACYVPARRATAVDPVDALRCE